MSPDFNLKQVVNSNLVITEVPPQFSSMMAESRPQFHWIRVSFHSSAIGMTKSFYFLLVSIGRHCKAIDTISLLVKKNSDFVNEDE